jgi:hypothetical protein
MEGGRCPLKIVKDAEVIGDMQMDKRELISRLKSLKDYYRGVPEQKE